MGVSSGNYGIVGFFVGLNHFIIPISIVAYGLFGLFVKYKDFAMLHFPFVGKIYNRLITHLDTYTMAKILALSLSAGLPMSIVMQSIIASVQGKMFKKELEKVANMIAESRSLTDAIKDTKLPINLRKVIRIGEKSGHTVDMAESLAESIIRSVDSEMIVLEKSLTFAMLIITVLIVVPVVLGLYLGYFGMFKNILKTAS